MTDLRTMLGKLLKGMLIVAGVFACLLALGLGAFYWSVRAQELPPNTASSYVRLEPGDEVLHAYTTFRWLDSQKYFLIKADPASFDARIKEISETYAHPPFDGPAGAPSAWRVLVSEGPGKGLWVRSDPVPSWWDVDALPSAVAVDVSNTQAYGGTLTIFSKDRGLIYILKR
jgi:hypothetical protein